MTEPDRHHGRVLRTYWLLALGVVAVSLLGLLAGSVAVDLADIWHMVEVRLGIADDERLTDSVLWAIRLPRVLAGLVAGAGLGVAGVALQGSFRNRMADPHLVGVAPAAGLGAVAGIALTPAGGTPLIMMLMAGAGGIALALLMRRIAENVPESGQLILVGIALGFALLALLGAIVLAWDSPRVPTFRFWVFGGLSGVTWSTLGAAVPLVVLGGAGVFSVGRSLDVLALGEDEARHLGVDVSRLRLVTLSSVGLMVGGAVGLAGVIGFVGLVVPMVIRGWVGPAHRRLAVLSALGGAIALAGLDVVARTVAAPVEIPVGLITAIGGAPVLVWFLLRRPRW
ncbi:MAG: iron ABC transporter permease [Acidimicrobiia bacterium]|nr:iron ABC transporter permease [Acidimicrobiia bacterium]